jgi:hypothetical protein
MNACCYTQKSLFIDNLEMTIGRSDGKRSASHLAAPTHPMSFFSSEKIDTIKRHGPWIECRSENNIAASASRPATDKKA